MSGLLKTICLSSILFWVGICLAQQEAEVPASITEQKAAIESKRESIRADKRKAELLQDEEGQTLLEYLDNFLEAQSFCFEKKEEVDADICVLSTLKKLAQAHNFIAEHELGNLYENSYGNVKVAMQWYKTAIDNPKTPRAYKIIILKDMDRVNSKGEGSSMPAPTSDPKADKKGS